MEPRGPLSGPGLSEALGRACLIFKLISRQAKKQILETGCRTEPWQEFSTLSSHFNSLLVGVPQCPGASSESLAISPPRTYEIICRALNYTFRCGGGRYEGMEVGPDLSSWLQTEQLFVSVTQESEGSFEERAPRTKL